MAQLKIEESRRSFGILLALLSTFSFSCMTIFAALNSPEIPVWEQTFFRNLVGLIVAGVVLKKNRQPLFGERKYWPYMLARSVFGFLAVALLFYASRNALQADVTILNRSSMVLISIVSVLFLHEKLTKAHIPAMIIAFAGAYIAANPRFDSAFLPLLAAFGTSLCDAVCYPLLSYFSGRVNAYSVVMFFCAFSTLASIPLMLPVFIMPTPFDLFCLIMIGVFAALGQILMTLSYHWAPAGELSIYNLVGILFSAILGYLILNQVPSIRTVIGGLLIVFAALLLFFYKKSWLSRQTQTDAAVSGGDGVG